MEVLRNGGDTGYRQYKITTGAFYMIWEKSRLFSIERRKHWYKIEGFDIKSKV